MQKIVNTVDENGNPIELYVNKPTAKLKENAQIAYSKAWLKAESSGCPLRIHLDDVAERQGLWNDDVKSKVEKIEREIMDTEKKLRAGSKFYKKLVDGKNAALHIRKLRGERLSLLSKKSSLDELTAESYAERARTNYLISMCVVYSNNGKPYFRDVNDYLERSDEKAAQDAGQAFLELMYSDLLEYEKKYYENQFLLKYGFVDEKFRLINKDGKLVDAEGREIDENGRYVKDGKFVDNEGNEVDEEGNYVIEFLPFEETE